MSEKSAIQWTDSSWNIVTGCSQVSPGCLNCYAERLTATRLREQPKYKGLTDAVGHWTGEVRCHPDVLEEPLHWKKPRRIFVASMSDLFHSKVPWEFIIKVFDVMRECPQHTFQLLTKRPGRMAHFAERVWPLQWPPHVWVGTSLEKEWDGKKRLMGRLDCLLQVPAKVRFVSAEPLLGPLDLKPYFFKCTGCGYKPCVCKGIAIHQVIIGGESGPGARPMDIAWARDLISQCDSAGVPVFVKQLGAKPYSSPRANGGTGYMLELKDRKGSNPAEWDEDLRRREFPCQDTPRTKIMV